MADTCTPEYCGGYSTFDVRNKTLQFKGSVSLAFKYLQVYLFALLNMHDYIACCILNLH